MEKGENWNGVLFNSCFVVLNRVELGLDFSFIFIFVSGWFFGLVRMLLVLKVNLIWVLLVLWVRLWMVCFIMVLKYFVNGLLLMILLSFVRMFVLLIMEKLRVCLVIGCLVLIGEDILFIIFVLIFMVCSYCWLDLCMCMEILVVLSFWFGVLK